MKFVFWRILETTATIIIILFKWDNTRDIKKSKFRAQNLFWIEDSEHDNICTLSARPCTKLGPALAARNRPGLELTVSEEREDNCADDIEGGTDVEHVQPLFTLPLQPTQGNIQITIGLLALNMSF